MSVEVFIQIIMSLNSLTTLQFHLFRKRTTTHLTILWKIKGLWTGVTITILFWMSTRPTRRCLTLEESVPTVLWSSTTKTITQAHSYGYLGVYIDESLAWSTHVDSLFCRLQQQLHFLRMPASCWCWWKHCDDILSGSSREPNQVQYHSVVWQPPCAAQK